MNEIQVIIQQTPGTVKWNFDEMKAALGSEMQAFETTEYTDDTVGKAKKDIAYLRKLRTSVEDRRKGVKEKCLEPYKKIEEQAKELIDLIDKPIEVINRKVQEYETRRKKAVRKEIYEFMAMKYDFIPEDIRDKAMELSYNPKWENVSTSKKTWKDAIQEKADAYASDLAVIQGVEEEFRCDAENAYKSRLVLSDAMSKVQELKKQKERFLEAEQRRKEQEEENRRRREEEREAKRKADAERAAKHGSGEKTSMNQDDLNRMAAQTLADLLGPNMELRDRSGNLVGKSAKATDQESTSEMEIYDGNPLPSSQIGRAIEQIEREAFQTAAGSFEGKPEQTIRIIGSPEQYQKILQYIKFIGADYEEV